MNPIGYRRTRHVRPVTEYVLHPWLLVPLSVFLGAFLASQFFRLQTRYIKLVTGLLFLGVLSTTPLYLSLCVFVVIFPFPTFIYLGDTNTIFVVALLAVWIVRVGMGQLPHPRRSPIDWAIVLYLLFYMLSFLNPDVASKLALHAKAVIYPVVGVLLFGLLYNTLRSERALGAVLKALCVMALLVDITAVYQILSGGKTLIPEWYLIAGRQSKQTDRIAGALGYHDVMADFSAILFYLQIVLGMRARSRAAKVFYYGLSLLGLLMIAVAVNRGGVVAVAVGGVIFLWYSRGKIRWPRLVGGAALLTFAVLALLLMTQPNLAEVPIFHRLIETRFVGGLPDTRIAPWTELLPRLKEHPWFGHGPYIDITPGTGMHWPHNGFLWYVYTIGIFGMLTWSWILAKLIWVSRPPAGGVNFGRAPLALAVLSLAHIQLLMFFVAQLRTDHQRGSVYQYFMWILFAVTAIAYRLVRDQQRAGMKVAEARP